MEFNTPDFHKTELENNLCRLANRKYCLLVSRGATALFLSYSIVKKLADQKGVTGNRIVLPAIMCHSPANVAIYAGLEIVFCDVRAEDYTLDPDCLRNIFQTTPGILAVVSASIFGHTPDMVTIDAICKEFNAWHIDDAAQSIGGFCSDQPLGGWGDVGIYSFGHTKIIDVGLGGALVTNSESIYKGCAQLYNELHERGGEFRELRSAYSETYYAVERLTDKMSALNALFWNFPTIFRSLYVYKDDTWDQKLVEILHELNALDDTIRKRHLNWNEYRERIVENPGVSFPLMRKGSVPWRFTFRIQKAKRNRIVNELRSRQIDVSTWYPSLMNRFSPAQRLYDARALPVAETLTDELINLWVDPKKVSAETIPATCDIINALANERDC